MGGVPALTSFWRRSRAARAVDTFSSCCALSVTSSACQSILWLASGASNEVQQGRERRDHLDLLERHQLEVLLLVRVALRRVRQVPELDRLLVPILRNTGTHPLEHRIPDMHLRKPTSGIGGAPINAPGRRRSGSVCGPAPCPTCAPSGRASSRASPAPAAPSAASRAPLAAGRRAPNLRRSETTASHTQGLSTQGCCRWHGGIREQHACCAA